MAKVTRRQTLQLGTAAGVAAAAGCQKNVGKANTQTTAVNTADKTMTDPKPNPIRAVNKLGFPWRPPDPFLACMHHDDRYPAGNEKMGPKASLQGRDMGQDFAGKDGWRMYHGMTVPGFPQHPHRGFETVTVVRTGLLDHSDSMGATARYGGGDVQWLTAGKGIQHAEMFPLLNDNAENPLELFQIWLNLPARDKMVEPHFTMLWDNKIPRVQHKDSDGKQTEVTVIAGSLGNAKPPSPPPDSWASQAKSDLAIWTIRMEPGARWTLPAASAGINRTLYYFEGEGLTAAGEPIDAYHDIQLEPDQSVELVAGSGQPTQILLLQGRPIGDPVVQYGPFVMNTRDEIQQAFTDYQRTQFGGWPWQSGDPVHDRKQGRFAKHPDGSTDEPT